MDRLDVGPRRLDVGDVSHLLRDGDTPQGRVPRRSDQWIALAASAYAGDAPCSATMRNASPSQRNKLANFASQMRVAFASMAWNTGSSSPGELLITRSTSAVAACCSSASASLFSSPARASRLPPTCVLAFVPVERSLRLCVRLFAPLRDKVTSSAPRSTLAPRPCAKP